MALDPVQVSLRLKAARYLAGGPARNGKGKETVKPLRVSALAALAPLQENGITRNRLEDFEQLRATARPMELEPIIEALGLPADWFSAESALTRTAAPQAQATPAAQETDDPLDGLELDDEAEDQRGQVGEQT